MIIALEEAKHKLNAFRQNIEELGSALRIDELKAKILAVTERTGRASK